MRAAPPNTLVLLFLCVCIYCSDMGGNGNVGHEAGGYLHLKGPAKRLL